MEKKLTNHPSLRQSTKPNNKDFAHETVAVNEEILDETESSIISSNDVTSLDTDE